MQRLLRSTFTARPDDDPKLFYRNVQALQDSGLGFGSVEDTTVWNYIRDFVNQHHHVPAMATLVNHFAYLKETETKDRVEALALMPSKTRGDFLTLMEEQVKIQRTRQTVEILKEAARIVETGITIKEGPKETILKGHVSAIQYVMDRGHDIVMPSTGVRLSGDVTADGENFMAEYERMESDPLAGIGQYTGISQLDDAFRGAKRGELWTHAAFTGGLKSTFALNWVYNQAVYYQHSSVFFSLEMPYHQVRRILYAMHSHHDKFKALRSKLGISHCLSYQRVRDGELDHYSDAELERMDEAALGRLLPDAQRVRRINPERPEKKFLQVVAKDFNNPKNEYGRIHIEVADPDKSDFTVPDLRSKAELIYSKDADIRMIIVDHMGLMSPRNRHSSTTERLNEVIRDLKRMAMSFNRGMGIAVAGLFQISREGYKAAIKADGRYNLTHLSYANEAERCVSAGTYVQTQNGFVPVGTVLQTTQTTVWSSEGWRQVLNRWDNGIRRLWAVTTDRGSLLEATSKHRVRVVADGCLEWKAVGELTTDDFVAGVLGCGAWPEEWEALPPLTFRRYEHQRSRGGETTVAPKCLNTEISYLFGAWDGDGSVHPDGIGFTGNRLEIAVRNKIQVGLSACFSGTSNLSEPPSRPGSFDIRKFGRPVKRWFENLAGPRATAVPRIILRAPKEAVTAYLLGLFDTDGWVNRSGIVGINMKGESEGFLREVQMLLTGLGIDSHLSMDNPLSTQTGKRYPKVTLRIRSRQGRARFASLIGFTDPNRMAKLSRIVHLGSVATRRGDVQVYPVPETFLRVYRLIHPAGTPQTRYRRSFYNFPARVRKTGLVPTGALTDLLRAAAEEGIVNDDVAFLTKLHRLQVMRVSSVVDTGRDEPVVDLEVEGDHEYLTGPLLSHNSSDIVTATFVDDDLRGRSLVRWQCLKSRDDSPFDVFYSGVLWKCRRVFTTHNVTSEDASTVGAEIDNSMLPE